MRVNNSIIDITDITEQVKNDFGDKATEVFNTLKILVAKNEYLNHPRVIRCIIYLAEKDLEKLKIIIRAAIADTRDVIFWAEYINHGSVEVLKRVRDFNKIFGESEKI